MMSKKLISLLTVASAAVAVMSLSPHFGTKGNTQSGRVGGFITPAFAQDGAFPLWGETESGGTLQTPPSVKESGGPTASSPSSAAIEPPAVDARPTFDAAAGGREQASETESEIELLPSLQEQLDVDWQLFSEGRFGELRGALVDRQLNDPGTPLPEELMDKLDQSDAKKRINNAVAARQYRLANKMLAQHDDLLTCDDVWFGWSMVEAAVLMNHEQRGIDLARTLNADCDIPDAELRDGLLRLADRIPPATMERILQDIDTEIDPAFAEDLARVVARQKIFNWINVQDAEYERRKKEAGREHIGEDNIENLVQRRFPEIDVPPEVQQAVSLLKSQNGWADARDRTVLGWFHYHSGDFEEAAKLFSEHVDGYDDKLRLEFAVAETWARLQQNDFLNAEKVLPDVGLPEAESYLWSNPYLMVIRALVNHVHRPEKDKDFAGVWEMPPENKARVYRTAKTRRDATLTQQIGWLEQRSCRCGEAINWFRLSLAEDDSQEDAAWGLAMCFDKEERIAELEALRLEWADTSPRIAGLISAAGGRLLTIPRLRPASLRDEPPGELLTGQALLDVIAGSMLLQKEEVPGCWPSDSVTVTDWGSADDEAEPTEEKLPLNFVPRGGEANIPNA